MFHTGILTHTLYVPSDHKAAVSLFAVNSCIPTNTTYQIILSQISRHLGIMNISIMIIMIMAVMFTLMIATMIMTAGRDGEGRREGNGC